MSARWPPLPEAKVQDVKPQRVSSDEIDWKPVVQVDNVTFRRSKLLETRYLTVYPDVPGTNQGGEIALAADIDAGDVYYFWLDIAGDVFRLSYGTYPDFADRTVVFSVDPDNGKIANTVAYEGIRVRGQTLTDKTSFSAVSTYEDWGSESINLGQPTQKVFVTAQLTGSVLSAAGVDSAGRVQVGISLDSGSSYDYGTGNWGAGEATGGTRRSSICASHQRSGTATGDIRVKAQAFISGGATTDLDFVTGTLTAQMAPDL